VSRLKVEGLNALTLATHDMGRSVEFYTTLGFVLNYGGKHAAFSSFRCGSSFLNVVVVPASKSIAWWGRAIFHVEDVDVTYQVARSAGFSTETSPRDAEWGERYFHILDPDGHELSFAKLLPKTRA